MLILASAKLLFFFEKFLLFSKNQTVFSIKAFFKFLFASFTLINVAFLLLALHNDNLLAAEEYDLIEHFPHLFFIVFRFISIHIHS